MGAFFIEISAASSWRVISTVVRNDKKRLLMNQIYYFLSQLSD